MVWCLFWDHCSGPADSTDPVKCEIVGILRNKTKLAYYIVPWICEANLSSSNSDVYCILRSSVIKFKEVVKGTNK